MEKEENNNNENNENNEIHHLVVQNQNKKYINLNIESNDSSDLVLPPNEIQFNHKRKIYISNKCKVFILTFGSYMWFHASRKSFSAVKGAMSTEKWMISNYFLRDKQGEMFGLMDTIFLSFYAIGLYISGILGDIFNLRKIISFGMILTSFMLMIFGISSFLKIHKFEFYFCIWSINGLIQSSGWPSNVAVMGKWFHHDERGAIMGLWSGCASFGNIVGTIIVAISFCLFNESFAWKISFIITGISTLLWGILIYFYLIPEPPKKYNRELIPLEENDIEKSKGHTPKSSKQIITDHNKLKMNKPLSFFKAWLIPGVIPYSIAFACLKSVNYSLFFWLPFYLTVSLKLEDSTADFLSIWYDVGQIIGGMLCGYISDKMGVRSPVIVVFIVLASFFVSTLATADHVQLTYLLILCGILIGGPSCLISTAISADLGSHASIAGNEEAISTVSGIIDGTGSIGAALFQYVIGIITACHSEPKNCDYAKDKKCHLICNWQPLFSFLEIGCILTALFLCRLFLNDICTWYNNLSINLSKRQRLNSI